MLDMRTAREKSLLYY